MWLGVRTTQEFPPDLHFIWISLRGLLSCLDLESFWKLFWVPQTVANKLLLCSWGFFQNKKNYGVGIVLANNSTVPLVSGLMTRAVRLIHHPILLISLYFFLLYCTFLARWVLVHPSGFIWWQAVFPELETQTTSSHSLVVICSTPAKDKINQFCEQKHGIFEVTMFPWSLASLGFVWCCGPCGF